MSFTKGLEGEWRVKPNGLMKTGAEIGGLGFEDRKSLAPGRQLLRTCQQLRPNENRKILQSRVKKTWEPGDLQLAWYSGVQSSSSGMLRFAIRPAKQTWANLVGIRGAQWTPSGLAVDSVSLQE